MKTTSGMRWIVLGLFVLLIGSQVLVYGESNITLNLWTELAETKDKAMIDGLVTDYNKQHPGVTVVHRVIGNEAYFATLRTGLAGNDPPDLFQEEGYFQCKKIAAEGLALDVNDWFVKNAGKFIAGAGNSSMYKNKVYGIPFDFQTEAQIYYNVDILKKHKVKIPKTWNEFLAACAKLKKAGVTPIALGTKDGWPGKLMFETILGQIVGAKKVWATLNADDGTRWTDPGFIKAAKMYKNLYDKGYYQNGCASADDGMAKAIFLSGKTAFYHTGSWFLSQSFPEGFNWDFFEFPKVADNTQMPVMCLDNLAISAKCKHPKEALAFLDWMVQIPQAKRWVENDKLSTIRGALTKDNASERLLRTQQIVEKAKASIAGLELCVPPSVGEDKIYNGAAAVVSGQMTAEQWMQSVEKASQIAKQKGEYLR